MMRHCWRKPTHFTDGETEAGCYEGNNETLWTKKILYLPNLFQKATLILCIWSRLVAITRDG